MSRPYRVSRHNFTLVEMAIAMAILVVVALIIGTASATFYNGYRRSAKVTEQLKAQDQMLWVQRMNNIWDRAIEIVNHELIYA